MVRYGTLLLVLAMSGCVESSNVLQLGPDTYSLSVYTAPVYRSYEGRVRAISEGQAYCSAKSQNFIATNINAMQNQRGATTTELVFQCLFENDPDLRRPTYARPADIVVENR